MGLAKFDITHKSKYLFLAILLPVIFHGTYDYFLFIGNTILNLAGTIISLIVAIQLSKKAIQKHQALSKETHGANNNYPLP